MKKSILAVVSVLSVSSCSTHTLIDDGIPSNTLPKNVIMVIGDGMGPAYTSAYRYYHDNPITQEVEETVFDRHLLGLSSTYPAAESGYVTDSAAGATGLSSGVKSYNGAVGVDVNKKAVQTVLEFAKTQGKKTGVVVTSRINHATPASYLSHNESRQNYNEIADSYYDEKINGHFKMDVMFGGGWKHFLRDDRNLVEEFKHSGFQYIDKYEQLDTIIPNQPALGLFSDGGLPWALDDSIPHRLSVMTKAATKNLENKQGFFLLIEGSQIDWGGHNNDIAAAMGEMDDLAKTLEYLEAYVAKNPNTLVVVTADHSTGGLSVAANGIYKWKPESLRSFQYSPHTIANRLTNEDITAKFANFLFNFDLTGEELEMLITVKHGTQNALPEKEAIGNPYQIKNVSNVNQAMYKAVKYLIDQKTNTGWTSSAHTAIDVPVFSFGSHSHEFIGLNDNTKIAKKIFTLLGRK
ncbi:MAG: alkaline phosphatase [Paraglaciecola sp.]|uniref:alkaline phosphatase n=1 Tax=Paraglaciecola sp. TaxID=1920173 RepID=UPI0032641A6A